MQRIRRHRPRGLIRRLALQLLTQTLVLQSHAFQLLLDFALLLVELVLPLLLLLQLLLEAFLLPERLLIVAALSQAGALQSGT
jgi:hypothetical protein